jgi:hypothetical protein
LTAPEERQSPRHRLESALVDAASLKGAKWRTRRRDGGGRREVPRGYRRRPWSTFGDARRSGILDAIGNLESAAGIVEKRNVIDRLLLGVGSKAQPVGRLYWAGLVLEQL